MERNFCNKEKGKQSKKKKMIMNICDEMFHRRVEFKNKIQEVTSHHRPIVCLRNGSQTRHGLTGEPPKSEDFF